MSSLKSQLSSLRSSPEGGIMVPMQANFPPEEEAYEVDIVDSFDLETYTSGYKGLALIYRLMYIADHCPKLQSDALQLAISHVMKTMNVDLYQILHHKLRQSQEYLLPDVTGTNPNGLGLPVINADWIESTTQKSAFRLEKLDAEFRHNMFNSVKESIRCGYNEIADHYVNCGYLDKAAQLYSKTRDYCTNPSHIMSMYFNIIKVGIYLQNWPQVVNYINQAESTIKDPDSQTTYNCTLKCMAGLTELAVRNYREAAQKFLQINMDYWDSTNLISANDIAIYGGLCALATFNRSELRGNVMCNRIFLELVPEMSEVIFKFYESKFEVCFKILDKMKPTILLDMYIGSCINQLYSNIKRKAMIQYFIPYDSADLRKMALCFHITLPDLEEELIKLISDGHINARIDMINKILYTKHPDQRVETFEKALSMAEQYSRSMHILLLRTQLVKKWLPTYVNNENASKMIMDNNIITRFNKE